VKKCLKKKKKREKYINKGAAPLSQPFFKRGNPDQIISSSSARFTGVPLISLTSIKTPGRITPTWGES